MKKIILRLLVLITLSKSSLYCSEEANDSMVYRFGRSYSQKDESSGGIFPLIFNSNAYFAADRIFREASTDDSMLNTFTGGRALNSLDWIKKNPKKFIGYSLGAIVAYDRASQSESLLNKFTRGTALCVVNWLKEKPGAFMAGATCLFLIGSAIASRYQPTDLEKSTQTDFDGDGFSVSQDSNSENSAGLNVVSYELNSSDEDVGLK
jgi:hypothetical protein